MIKRDMIKFLSLLKYDRTQHDKHFGIFLLCGALKMWLKKLPVVVLRRVDRQM